MKFENILLQFVTLTACSLLVCGPVLARNSEGGGHGNGGEDEQEIELESPEAELERQEVDTGHARDANERSTERVNSRIDTIMSIEDRLQNLPTFDR